MFPQFSQSYILTRKTGSHAVLPEASGQIHLTGLNKTDREKAVCWWVNAFR
jgi:hypothetical protein